MVVCANGAETPRLLLMSANAQFPVVGRVVQARAAHRASVPERGQRELRFAGQLCGVVRGLRDLRPAQRQGGGEADVQTLRHWLADPAGRLITLIGAGGVGKTRLALELARAIADEGASRVVLAPLAAIRDYTFVASAIAEALGLTDGTALDLPERARAACEDRATLLVLDNFEQVLDAAPLVADLLTSVASLRLLVTSRAPLRVRGEREYTVGPLALHMESDATAPADLARAPAVRLFMERVRDVQPDFRLTSANGSTVTAIGRRLDALPLALELVAPHEQRAFRRLGVLPGRFPIEPAAAVLAGREDASGRSDVALRALAGLIHKSLLLRAETSIATRPLYQMLETVRAYAALELTAASERDDALEGLARYCTGEASLAAEGLVGPAQGEWLDRVHDDLENYRDALTWLIEHGRPTEASDIAWGLMWFWVIRGHASEGLRWYEQILKLPSLPPGAESRVLLGAAISTCKGSSSAHASGSHAPWRSPAAPATSTQSCMLRLCSGTWSMPLAIWMRPETGLPKVLKGSRRRGKRGAPGMG